VIAVLLSGLYDDGVQGLQIIHRNGGMVIVLKPDDTAFSQMPENAIKYDHPDYVLSASDYFPNSSNWSQIRKAAPQYAATTKQLSTMSRRRAMCVQTAGERHLKKPTGNSLLSLPDRAFISVNALLSGGDDALETALWAAVRSLQENAD